MSERTKLTNQQTFDKVYLHLMEQGKPAVNQNGNCRYRTSEGLMCAAGAILDEEGHSRVDTVGTCRSEENFILFAEYVEEVLFLTMLQQEHDFWANPEYRRLNKKTFRQGIDENFRKIAEQCGLKFKSVLDQYESEVV